MGQGTRGRQKRVIVENALTSVISGTVAVSDIEVGGAPISPTNPVFEEIVTAGAVVSPSNRLPVDVTGSITADFEGDLADLDSDPGGGSIDNHEVIAIGLPASGGHVVGGTAANPLRTDPTGTTAQPISASTLPLPTGAATSALQTQPGVDIGDVTVNNAAGAAAVNIQDGGNSITVDGTFFPATQPVSVASLPLPAGAATEATLTTAAASLSVIDDWDESDRAKVNPIVGSAGVQGGAGATTAATQRTVTATDDAGVVSLGVMDDWDETDRAKVNPIVGSAGVQGGSGVVTASTQRCVLATDVPLPAGTNNIGSVTVGAVPEEKTFIISSLAVAIGLNKSMLSLFNDGAGSAVLKLLGMFIRNAQTTGVTGIMADFRLYRMTGHSAGTNITANAQQADTTETLDSNVTLRTGATISGEFANHIDRWLWSSDEFGTGAADVESADHPIQSLLKHHDRPVVPGKPLVIRPNQGITLKQITNSTAGSFDIVFIFCHA